MAKRKTKPYVEPLVECPFCKEKVKAKELADHAKSLHANDPKFSKKPVAFQPRLLEGVEVENAEIVHSFNQLVVDESGMLVNPHLMENEHRKSRDERMGTASLAKPKFTKRKSKPSESASRSSLTKTGVDDAFRDKVEWLDSLLEHKKVDAEQQSRFVNCPVCNMELKPNNLSAHISKAHSHINLAKVRAQQAKTKRLADRQLANNHNTPHPTKKPKQDTVRQPEKKVNHKQSSSVKCPLCQQMFQYEALVTHLKVSHPEIDSKPLVTKIKKLYKNNDPKVQHRYEEELNSVLQRYEKLKPRDD